MLQSTDRFLDFDGTLVCENSSIVLIEELFARATTTREKFLRTLIKHQSEFPVRILIGLIRRLTKERDVVLSIILKVYRHKISRYESDIFVAVAKRLTLQELPSLSEGRFTIVSTGLTPVIESFLVLHDELKCSEIYASELTLKPWHVKIMSLMDKERVISQKSVIQYMTDSKKEAKMLLKDGVFHRQDTLTDQRLKNVIYKLEKD
ncbi:MAG TPA: HAD family hydrolase [Candidatus Saccharimonadales bacterium]|nr:HAD family hydrolase [Candidatus Saccharimonadales bacterium]